VRHTGDRLRDALRRADTHRIAFRVGLSLTGGPRLVGRGAYDGASEFSGTVELNEWMAFRGRLFVDVVVPAVGNGNPVVALAVLFTGEQWEQQVQAGRHESWSVPIPASQTTPEIALGVRYEDGTRHVVSNPGGLVTTKHDFHGPHARFVAALNELSDGVVVEVGSRARSGRTYTDLVPDHLRYIGVDIVDGPNVDVVGDAHDLTSIIEPCSVDAVFSIATFEHLAMPWRCAVEINRILKPGGVCFVLSHQTFPLHETPWDFFRFSDSGWRAIFNRASGFEVLEVAMGDAAAVVGLALTPITWNMDRAVACLGSAVACRKVGEATVDWPVPLHEIASTAYPG